MLTRYNYMETQPTFAERTAALKEVAVQLRTFAELIMREAQRMDAAGQRFANRSARRDKQDRKSTRLNSSHSRASRMPSSA